MRATNAPQEAVCIQRVAVVDDHTFMREGIRMFIESLEDFEWAWAAVDVPDALAKLEADCPDVLVLDITLPGRNGLELIKDAQARHPSLPLLVFSMHEETHYAYRAIKAGAKGYLMKAEEYDVFENALRRVTAGKLWLSESVSDIILQAFTKGVSPKIAPELDTLTYREFEVFSLLAEGRSTAQIAESMCVSTRTVDAYRVSIREKLRLADGAALIRYAIRWGSEGVA